MLGEKKEDPLRISHGQAGSDSLVRPWGSLTAGSPLPHPHAGSYMCVRFKRLLSMVGRILILPPRPLVLLYTSAVILANMSLGTAEEETAYRIKILSQLALRGGNYLGGPESLRWRVFSSRTQMSEFKHEEDSWS